MSSKIQKPTVGRIVHLHKEGCPVRSGIITAVWEGGRVNAKPFDDDRNTTDDEPKHHYTIDHREKSAVIVWSWRYPAIERDEIEVEG